ncbi:CNNM domain-containing protein [Idiomarina baltica]|uniref:Membrane hemolisin TlyC, contains CBS domains n=1 Tax=Idiomarina baltica OS145 TaxID=314276 RepID=A0ABP2CSX4_9GAMM|nr:CNNM domain-containing protein [Idiomarina baltica]EAQ32242.1 Membrane hemolisin TlyC, contains CBS domains [Idiomarina baltica OS145]MEC8926180.1 CNNM domain-containing protein [Pseudomonadota bacterium]
MFLLIVFAFIAIGISFLCSMLEASLLSITPSYIAGLKEQRPKLHKQLSKLKQTIDRPLAAILTLNTIAHTAGAAGVGAQVGVVFGDGYLGAASAVMTLLILILSEIIPKTIGAKFWRSLAPLLPGILNFLITSLKPFIWLSDQITKRIGANEADIDVRSEIKAMATMGLEQNALDEDERRVIWNILDLHDIRVKQVMTPRTVCETVRPDMTIGEFYKHTKQLPFSRFPVIDADEEPHGILFRSDALEADQETTLAELTRPVEIVTETVSVEALMAHLLQERQHMCLVYDEHGSWLGLITLEDIIETILGTPIMDETDNIASLRRYARQRWDKRLKGSPKQPQSE